MCLFAKNKKLTAKTDIVCYKVLQSLDSLQCELNPAHFQKNKKNGAKYLTPYTYFHMELGKTYDCKGEKYDIWDDCPGYVRVCGGFIHTFSSLKDALEAIAECGMYGAIVVKSIIPKGTKYYQGSMKWSKRDNVESYASRVMVLGTEDDIIAYTDEQTTSSQYEGVVLNYQGNKYFHAWESNGNSAWRNVYKPAEHLHFVEG